jgi:Tfp pilus assembly PilM family ATPase
MNITSIYRKLQKKTNPNILALDMFGQAIKVLELNGDHNHPSINIWAKKPIQISLEETLRVTIAQLNTKTKYAAVALPYSAILSKVIPINNNLSEKEIEQYCYFIAEKHFETAANTLNLDFHILEQKPNSTDLQVELVATHKERVAAICATLQQVDLIPQFIDVDSIALERAARFNCGDFKDVIALINLNLHNFLIQFIDNTQTIYAHEYSAAATTTLIINGIQLGIATTNKHPGKILLCGEASLCKQLQKELQTKNFSNVAILNPFASFSSKPPELDNSASEFTLCFGLCLRQLENDSD